MLKKQIRVGGHYIAKVSNKLVPVRVDAIREDSGAPYAVTNLSTGRKTSFRSAAKFRKEITPKKKEPTAATHKEEIRQAATKLADEVEQEMKAEDILATALCHRCGSKVPLEDGCYAYHRHPTKGITCGMSGEKKTTEGKQSPDPTIASPNMTNSSKGNSSILSANSKKSMVSAHVLKETTTAPAQSANANLNSGPSKPGSVASALSAIQGKKQKDTAPHVIVEARAGTGKTTTLVAGLQLLKGLQPTNAAGKVITPSPQQKAVWDAIGESKGKASTVCFCAFNHSIAKELRERVPPGCDAMTMHAMGYRAVRGSFTLRSGNDAVAESDGRIKGIVAELLGMTLRQAFQEKSSVLLATVKLANLCKMNLVGVESELTEEALDELASHYEIELDGEEDIREEVFALIPRVLERCKDVKRDGQIDFADMIWLPIALKLRIFRYDLLLIDEAQDLNRCQQALAKLAGRRLILCGDPKQAIYGFAGADCESMFRMADELARLPEESYIGKNGMKTMVSPRGCMTLPLTVTRRCGKAIVREANKIVPEFEAHESNPEGVISDARYPTARTKGGDGQPKEREEKDTYIPLVQDGDFLLCRVNAPLVSQCFRFLRAGRKAVIQGRDIGQGLISLVVKLSGGDSRNEHVPALVANLSDWLEAETAKENAKSNPSEFKLIAMTDKVDCLYCFAEGAKDVSAIISKINSIFVDDDKSPGIRLSSIHKAKGLEARRVFLLEPERATVPHPMAKSPWQIEQEWNLRYVAITRAIEELVYVS